MRDRPAAMSADAGDKRGEGRKAVLKRAQVVFNGAAMDCIVENMSSGGVPRTTVEWDTP